MKKILTLSAAFLCEYVCYHHRQYLCGAEIFFGMVEKAFNNTHKNSLFDFDIISQNCARLCSDSLALQSLTSQSELTHRELNE